MAVKHDIDDEAQLITTTLSENAIDSDLIDALKHYFSEVKNQPQYEQYNEIIDLRKIKGIQIDTNDIRELAQISATHDRSSSKTKLAIIASSILAFGFAKIYEIARKLNAKNSKEVRVFKNKEDALSWISEAI